VNEETGGELTISLANRRPTGEPSYTAGPRPLSGIGEGVDQGNLTITMRKASAEEARGQH